MTKKFAELSDAEKAEVVALEKMIESHLKIYPARIAEGEIPALGPFQNPKLAEKVLKNENIPKRIRDDLYNILHSPNPDYLAFARLAFETTLENYIAGKLTN